MRSRKQPYPREKAKKGELFTKKLLNMLEKIVLNSGNTCNYAFFGLFRWL